MEWIAAALQLATLAESEIRRQQAATGQTREQVIAESERLWSEAQTKAEDLKNFKRPDAQ